MIRLRAVSGLVKAALGLSLLTFLVVACDEDGKTVPAKCVDTAEQPIFDISTDREGGDPDYSAIPSHDNPCITNTGHAVSPVSGGSSSGGTSAAGTSNGGTTGTVNGGADGGGDDSGGAPANGADAGTGGS